MDGVDVDAGGDGVAPVGRAVDDEVGGKGAGLDLDTVERGVGDHDVLLCRRVLEHQVVGQLSCNVGGCRADGGRDKEPVIVERVEPVLSVSLLSHLEPSAHPRQLDHRDGRLFVGLDDCSGRPDQDVGQVVEAGEEVGDCGERGGGGWVFEVEQRFDGEVVVIRGVRCVVGVVGVVRGVVRGVVGGVEGRARETVDEGRDEDGLRVREGGKGGGREEAAVGVVEGVVAGSVGECGPVGFVGERFARLEGVHQGVKVPVGRDGEREGHAGLGGVGKVDAGREGEDEEGVGSRRVVVARVVAGVPIDDGL